MTPKYTFLLPAYKMEFLEAALSSILAQTYSDFSVVVSDDASPEPLKNIVDKLHDPRLTYRRNEKNMGADNLVKHWNTLLEDCDSMFVIIASDDDIYHPYFLQRIDELCNKYPDAYLFKTPSEIIDGEDQVIKRDSSFPALLSQEAFIHHLINPASVLCIGNFVFRLSGLKALGGFINFPLGWKSDSATEIALAANGVPCTDQISFSFRMSGLNISSHSQKDEGRDRKKLLALNEFQTWIQTSLPDSILESVNPHVKYRLEGEIRSYYWVLSPQEFFPLYCKMNREGWFRSLRSSLSFLNGWIHSWFNL